MSNSRRREAITACMHMHTTNHDQDTSKQQTNNKQTQHRKSEHTATSRNRSHTTRARSSSKLAVKKQYYHWHTHQASPHRSPRSQVCVNVPVDNMQACSTAQTPRIHTRKHYSEQTTAKNKSAIIGGSNRCAVAVARSSVCIVKRFWHLSCDWIKCFDWHKN